MKYKSILCLLFDYILLIFVFLFTLFFDYDNIQIDIENNNIKNENIVENNKLDDQLSKEKELNKTINSSKTHLDEYYKKLLSIPIIPLNTTSNTIEIEKEFHRKIKERSLLDDEWKLPSELNMNYLKLTNIYKNEYDNQQMKDIYDFFDLLLMTST